SAADRVGRAGLARHVLLEWDGALRDQRDRIRLRAGAVDRGAAGGVGSARGLMIQDPAGLTDEFVSAVSMAGLNPPRSRIEHERQPATHRPHALPAGKCAVYVFSLSERYGRQC